MKTQRLSSLILCLLFPLLFFGQINISELVKPSISAKQSDNALYFVDFWATWCGPCIHVSKYLSVLQKQHPDSFYIISLTQENPDVVKRFLKKHDTDLAIAIDFEGETFKKYNIKSMPEGMLFNAKGNVLWKGHPADFKSSHVKRYLSQNRKEIALNKMFKVQKSNHVVRKKEAYSPSSDFEIFEIENNGSTNVELINGASFLELKGSLQNILAYTFKVHNDQIILDPKLNKNYHLYFKKNALAIENKNHEIELALNLNFNISKAKGDALVLKFDDSRFWNTNQIDWGQDGRQYLIDDSQIQADNVTFNDIKYKLSSVLEMPVVLKGRHKSEKKHDWQIHYKYFSLMQSDLLDNFGIQANKQKIEYPIYNVTKKGS